MDYKTHIDELDDYDDSNENHKDSHNLTPGVYSPKESKGKSFMVALKTKLSPRAKTKVIHRKTKDSKDSKETRDSTRDSRESMEYENDQENTKTATENSSKTKQSQEKVKAATEKTKTLATNAAYKTKTAAQNLGDSTTEAAKNCWTEIKHKSSDVSGKMDEIAPSRRYARLGSESD